MAVCAHDPKADDTEERRKGYKAKMKQWFSGGKLALEIPGKEGSASAPPSASRAATVPVRDGSMSGSRLGGNLVYGCSPSGIMCFRTLQKPNLAVNVKFILNLNFEQLHLCKSRSFFIACN